MRRGHVSSATNVAEALDAWAPRVCDPWHRFMDRCLAAMSSPAAEHGRVPLAGQDPTNPYYAGLALTVATAAVKRQRNAGKFRAHRAGGDRCGDRPARRRGKDVIVGPPLPLGYVPRFRSGCSCPTRRLRCGPHSQQLRGGRGRAVGGEIACAVTPAAGVRLPAVAERRSRCRVSVSAPLTMARDAGRGCLDANGYRPGAGRALSRPGRRPWLSGTARQVPEKRGLHDQ